MTDTVKLIIEIPKDYYEVMTKTEVIMTSPRSGKTFMSIIYSAVAHGIPLDDVKAEIMQLDYELESFFYASNDMLQAEMVHTICREEVLQILDNIGKAESEDKE